MVIPFETRQYVFERVKMKVPNAITVTPSVLQPYRHYLLALPPKTKVDFIWPVPDKSFQVRELFPIQISYQCLKHSRVLGAFEGHRSAKASRTVLLLAVQPQPMLQLVHNYPMTYDSLWPWWSYLIHESSKTRCLLTLVLWNRLLKFHKPAIQSLVDREIRVLLTKMGRYCRAPLHCCI